MPRLLSKRLDSRTKRFGIFCSRLGKKGKSKEWDEEFTRHPTDHYTLTDQKVTIMNLTKDDIVEVVAKEIGFPKNQSVELVETLLELIKKTLESGEDVLVSGFGKFRVREKKERRGRNPATGDKMMLRPRRVVTFHCSGKLRRKINR